MTPPYRRGHAPGASNYRSSDVTFGSKPGQRMMVIAAQASEPPCASSAGKFMQACRRGTDFKRDLCADIHGFSPHAAVRCGADDRQALKPLCHYITRPALADERVQCNAVGQVVLKTPWHDGTTHLVMSPLELMLPEASLAP